MVIWSAEKVFCYKLIVIVQHPIINYKNELSQTAIKLTDSTL
jgi:hypothetical protein